MPSVKPTLHPLRTPMSATFPLSSFPSELPRSPLPGSATELLKQEDGIKTPITPPTAYTDFLKSLSTTSLCSPTVEEKSGKSSPTSNPSSDTSGCSCNCEPRHSPKFTLPPSPHPRQPHSAPATGPLRRLRIPQSPLWSPGADSPVSARSIRSPFSIRSPNEWDMDGKLRAFDALAPPRSTRPVSVRQVVTRTVTYTPRMDLAPAPKGKKRRTE
ncbi:MAG: hypothetical protein M1838_000447 [Thelocarpon superellum]|nr:MAG: hypothetical protein M1838_000447 [Thelocarpon superellum]